MAENKTDSAVSQAATAITLSKLKAIAERLHGKGKEPSVEEARFAATFVTSVKVDTLIRWLEQLRDAMDCATDAEKIQRFIDNLKG